MANSRLSERKDGLWARIKRIALTDVGALMRGLNADDLEKMERVLIEADFGVAATVELTQALEDEVRKGKLKTEADLKLALEQRLTSLLNGTEHPASMARAADGSDGHSAGRCQRHREDHHRGQAGPAAPAARAGRCCSRRPTPIARGRSRSSRSGPTGSASPASPVPRVAIRRRSRSTPSMRRSPAGSNGHHRHGRPPAYAGRPDGGAPQGGPGHRPAAAGAPHETLLVLDGTVGQNAVQQGKLFAQAVEPDGHRRHQARRQRPRWRGRGAAPRARPADPVPRARRGGRRSRAVRPQAVCGAPAGRRRRDGALCCIRHEGTGGFVPQRESEPDPRSPSSASTPPSSSSRASASVGRSSSSGSGSGRRRISVAPPAPLHRRVDRHPAGAGRDRAGGGVRRARGGQGGAAHPAGAPDLSRRAARRERTCSSASGRARRFSTGPSRSARRCWSRARCGSITAGRWRRANSSSWRDAGARRRSAGRRKGAARYIPPPRA